MALQDREGTSGGLGMATEYRSVEYRLHECLVQMQEMLSVLDFDQTLLDSIRDCKDLIKSKQYNIAVMGEFKRGKSSLINALLGAKILPADATPTTATVNRITYGAAPRATVTFQDGKNQEICIDELTDYVTKITADGEARALQIKEATVYFPTVICQNHIDIIDTPGLNDETRMTQITIEMIGNVDAVIVPIHARAPFSETEKKFVCQLIESDGIHNLVFVVTFLDQLDEDDYKYEKFMEYIRRRIQSEVFAELEKRNSPEKIIHKAHQLLDQLQINGISSSLALESFISNNRALQEKSRFEPFVSALLHTVTAKQLENAIRKAIENVQFVVSQFDQQNQKRRGFLEDGFREFDRCADLLGKYCSDSPRALDTVFSNDFDKLQTMISSFNTNKNYIVQEFIKGLSQVRQNNHEVILAALNGTADRVRREIQTRCAALQKKMIQVFEAALPPLQERERRELRSVFALTGVSKMAGFDETAQAMLRFAETIFSNTAFAWGVPYIPRVPDLANCNVIETVIQSADVSVANYIGELNQIVNIIRKNWFGQFSAYIETLSSCVMDELSRNREAQDLQYKAYLRNYQTFYQNAHEVLSQCETLWEEFEEGERS